MKITESTVNNSNHDNNSSRNDAKVHCDVFIVLLGKFSPQLTSNGSLHQRHGAASPSMFITLNTYGGVSMRRMPSLHLHFSLGNAVQITSQPKNTIKLHFCRPRTQFYQPIKYFQQVQNQFRVHSQELHQKIAPAAKFTKL